MDTVLVVLDPPLSFVEILTCDHSFGPMLNSALMYRMASRCKLQDSGPIPRYGIGAV